jgi:hypothetical protein
MCKIAKKKKPYLSHTHGHEALTISISQSDSLSANCNNLFFLRKISFSPSLILDFSFLGYFVLSMFFDFFFLLSQFLFLFLFFYIYSFDSLQRLFDFVSPSLSIFYLFIYRLFFLIMFFRLSFSIFFLKNFYSIFFYFL